MFTVLHKYTDDGNAQIERYLQCDTFVTVVGNNGEIEWVAVTDMKPTEKQNKCTHLVGGFVYLMNETGKTIAKFDLSN